MTKIRKSTGTQVQVEVPELLFPGASPQSHFWLSAADKLQRGYPMGGGAVKEAVARVLEQIGTQLREAEVEKS